MDGNVNDGFSKTELVVLPQGACWAIVFAAIEVFPKECIGGVSLASRHGPVAVAEFASAYQLAMRKMDEVASNSGMFFDGVVDKLADFHSHPHVGREVELTEPSDMDLDGMNDGDIEVIICVGRKKNKIGRSLKSRRGTIAGSIGRFRFAINAFIRVRERDDGDIDYRRVMLSIL